MYLLACVTDLEKTQRNVIHVSVKQVSEVKATMTSMVIFLRQCWNSIQGQKQLYQTKLPK